MTEPTSGGLPIRSSPAIEQLLAALAQAQGTFPTIEKDKHAHITTRAGAKFSYSYADLAAVLGAVRAPLSANALSLLQPVVVRGHAVIVTTVLAHASGQWCSSDLELPITDPADARSLASAITYGRRYSLISLLALAPAEGEDDDAAAATPQPAAKPKAPAVRNDSSDARTLEAPAPTAASSGASRPAYISEPQRKRLFAIAAEHGYKAEQLKDWLITQGFGSTSKILVGDYDGLIEKLTAAINPVDHPF